MRTPTISAVALFTLLSACGNTENSGPPIRMAIPRGATLTAVAESLSTHQIISSVWRFKTYVKLKGQQGQIQAGTYDFLPGSSMKEILVTITTGREATDSLTLPEGLMLSEISVLVHEQLGIDTAEFSAAIRDSSLLAELDTPMETLEGYLYPSTYYVRAVADAEEVVQQIVDGFLNRWRSEWDERLLQLGMSRHEIVTLASIIEGEVRDRSESKTVSSVYHNRLRRGMRLQADPTVIYSLGLRRRLFQRDYSFRSPYNTYLIDGLPPGPVNQPSITSIEAALYPADTEYLYFVAGADGRHVFTRTYNEHLAAIRRIRNPEGT